MSKKEEVKTEEVKTEESAEKQSAEIQEETVSEFESDRTRLVEFLKAQEVFKEDENIVDTVISTYESATRQLLADAEQAEQSAIAIKELGEKLEAVSKENAELKDHIENTPALGVSEEDMPQGRLLAEGTRLQMGDTTITLASAAIVSYEGEENEPKFAAMCAMSDNLDANRELLNLRYDGLGNLLPLAEQTDDAKELPKLMKRISRAEAVALGCEVVWAEHNGEKI